MNSNPLVVQKFNKINDIIKNLYEDEQNISQKYDYFLSALKEIVYFDTGNVVFYSEHDQKYELEDLYQIGWDKETIDKYVKHYYKEDDIYPIFATKTPLVVRCTDIFQEARRKTEYYQNFMKPAGFEYSMECNIVLPSDINYYGAVSLFRVSTNKNFSVNEMKILEILQPHLSNLTKRNILKTLESLRANYTGFTVYGNIIINDSFETLSCSDNFKNIINRYCEEATVEKKIIELCKSMQGTDSEIRLRDLSYKFDQYPLYLEIVTATQKSEPTRNIYACNLYDISEMLKGCMLHIRKKYKLSPREFDIVSYQLKGYKVEEIAQLLCISNSTVKKHVSAIYNKLQIDSQMQLVRILGVLR